MDIIVFCLSSFFIVKTRQDLSWSRGMMEFVDLIILLAQSSELWLSKSL